VTGVSADPVAGPADPGTASAPSSADRASAGRRAAIARSFDAATVRRLSGLLAVSPTAATAEVTAPYDGGVLAEVPLSTAADVTRAVSTARAAQQDWSAWPLADRAAVMLRFSELVLERQERLLDVMQLETGKNRLTAFEEVEDVAITARYYAHSARRHLRPRRRQGAFPVLTRTTELRHPKGVVGIISPWNYPLTLPLSDAVPALVAGNAVVLKPDSQTPFTALAAIELLFEAGLPRQLFQIVSGPGKELGDPLIDGVDYLMFTGSTATGRSIAERCGRRLIGFSAELGGKNPMIVLDDAPLADAVDGAVRGCFGNTGQLCISIERIYVERGIHDAFVEAFVDRVHRMRIGNDLEWETEMGSLIDAKQLKVVTEHVDDAVARGAQVLTGGRARPDLGPFFYEPTLLVGVTGDMILDRTETFGPVIAIHPVEDADEAIARANDSEYGLNASIWTDPARGRELAARIHAGTVNVNEAYAATWGSVDAPMGGMKASGMGRRHGAEGILKYTEAQTVAVQRGLPIGPITGVEPERYAQLMTGALKIIRRLHPFVD